LKEKFVEGFCNEGGSRRDANQGMAKYREKRAGPEPPDLSSKASEGGEEGSREGINEGAPGPLQVKER